MARTKTTVKTIQKANHFTVYVPANTPDEVVAFLQSLQQGSSFSQDIMAIFGQYLSAIQTLGLPEGIYRDLADRIQKPASVEAPPERRQPVAPASAEPRMAASQILNIARQNRFSDEEPDVGQAAP